MEITICGVSLKISADTIIALVALFVSIGALCCSIYFWRRQFRPIVTVAIRTAKAGNEAIAYNLEILNSGAIPARNILLTVDEITLPEAFGADASEHNKVRWLACFGSSTQISILHNQSRMLCSFGTTKANNQGFWKYRARLQITVRYKGWFGKSYLETQVVQVLDSDSFTGHTWGNSDA